MEGRKYLFEIYTSGEDTTEGYIELTLEEAKLINFASDPKNWSSIIKDDDYSGSFGIDIDNPICIETGRPVKLEQIGNLIKDIDESNNLRYYCAKCGSRISTVNFKNPNFCYECGAKLTDKKEEK